MAMCRGLTLLAETRTGRQMLAGAAAAGGGTALVLRRRTSGLRSLGAGAAVGAAGVAVVAYLGHRLVQAGQELADQTVPAVGPEP